MGAKVKVTVSVEAELIRELGSVSRRTGKARSQLVEEALRLWQRGHRAKALEEGYRAMAREDRATARRYRRAVREVLE